MARAAAGSVVETGSELDAPLVLQCVRGDDAAWRSLHLQYYPVTVAFLRKLGVGDDDIDDAAQEVFLQMHRYLASFRGESELKTWLYRLCITEARRVRRRRRIGDGLRRLLTLSPPSSLLSSPPFSEHSARRRVSAALDSLTENERSVLVLYELEGLPGKQIAEVLGCKEATLWRRLHYARKRFLALMEDSNVEGT